MGLFGPNMAKNGKKWWGAKKLFPEMSPKSLQKGLLRSHRVPNYFSTLWIEEIRIFEEVMILFWSNLGPDRAKKGGIGGKKSLPVAREGPPRFDYPPSSHKGTNTCFLALSGRAESFALGFNRF